MSGSSELTWGDRAKTLLKAFAAWLIGCIVVMVVAAILPYRSRIGDLGLGFGFGYMACAITVWWVHRR